MVMILACKVNPVVAAIRILARTGDLGLEARSQFKVLNARDTKLCRGLSVPIASMRLSPTARIQKINSENTMSKTNTTASQRGISLDVYAVALALVLALLVRLNLIPPVKW